MSGSSPSPPATQPDGTESDVPNSPTVQGETPTGPWWLPPAAPAIGAVVLGSLTLTPSLVPHGGAIQGVVLGLGAGVGYGIGATTGWLMASVLGLPQPWRPSSSTRRLIDGGCLALLALMLVLGRAWQDDVREAMGAPTSSPVWWLQVLLVGGAVLVALVAASRAVRRLGTRTAVRAATRTSKTAATALGAMTAAVVTLAVVGAIALLGFLAIDRAFAGRDADVDPAVAQPTSAVVSGSPDSAVSWTDLGSDGRDFISAVPTTAQLEEFNGPSSTKPPVRVYVGLSAAADAATRAQLALADLETFGAFEREVLVVATSTGTGFLDRMALEPIEYMYAGDTAIVSTQYSTLPSWLSFLVDQSKAREAAAALFEAVHQRWSQMPVESRPRLLVFGESLGAYGAEAAFADVADMAARTDGALFVGPPAVSTIHRSLTDHRAPGSPEWQPIVDRGALVRFGSYPTDLDRPEAPWGPPRLAYLQNATDPVVFWSPRSAFTRPDWIAEPPGPNVWPQMRWLPLVTFLKLTGDMMDSTSVPAGNGHVYGGSQAGAWTRIAPPDGWTDTDTERLRTVFP